MNLSTQYVHARQFKKYFTSLDSLNKQTGSPFRAALSQAVLKMQETNRLLILKKKWWQEMRGGGACKVYI